MAQGQIFIANASNQPKWSDATHPDSTSQGDIIYASGANVYSNLAKNTNASRYLANTGASNAPQWDQINLANGVTGILDETNGGTGQNTFTTGDILYASAANTLSKLAIGSSNQVLTVVGGIPSWQPASGGSGITSLTTDTSGPVTPSAGAVDVTGTNVYSDGSVANTLTLNLQGTNNALFVGRGTNTPSASLAVGATGTVLIGNTAADPSFSASPALTSITLSGGTSLSTYQEGTFTPTLVGNTTAGTTTYTLQTGVYRRIGKVVAIFVTVAASAATGTGSARIDGFPFTFAAGGGSQAGAMTFSGAWAWPASTSMLTLEPVIGTTSAFIKGSGSNATAGFLAMTNATFTFRANLCQVFV